MKAQDKNRRFCLQALGTALAACALPAHAQSTEWPTRPLRFVIGAAAGDANDIALRRFLTLMAPEVNGVGLLVDNKPGAGGLISHQDVLNSPADGQTVLVSNTALVILPSVHKKLPYNPVADLTPVTFTGFSALGLAIPASRPEKTFKEWITWAKQQKGKLNYGSGGPGSLPHLYGFQLSDSFDLDAVHIAHKGATPVLRDLVSNTLQYAVIDLVNQRQLLTSGQLRLLAVTGTDRSKYMPDTPTFKELGVSGFERMGWSAWHVKSGTPAATIERLAAIHNRVQQRPEWMAVKDQFWIEWRPMSPADAAAQMKREAEAWAALIKKSGHVPD